jgi:hypothetical protein
MTSSLPIFEIAALDGTGTCRGVRRQRLAAVRAIVVEELDHTHIPVRIARDESKRQAKDFIALLESDVKAGIELYRGLVSGV